MPGIPEASISEVQVGVGRQCCWLRSGSVVALAAQAGFVRRQDACIDRHTYGGVHSSAFERVDLAHGPDAAGCGDGEFCYMAELTEPAEIGAFHGALVVHEG